MPYFDRDAFRTDAADIWPPPFSVVRRDQRVVHFQLLKSNQGALLALGRNRWIADSMVEEAIPSIENVGSRNSPRTRHSNLGPQFGSFSTAFPVGRAATYSHPFVR